MSMPSLRYITCLGNLPLALFIKRILENYGHRVCSSIHTALRRIYISKVNLRASNERKADGNNHMVEMLTHAA